MYSAVYEAREALLILTGSEFANKAVVFICEAQMLLDDVYQVRKEMHEASDDAACCASRLLARCSRSHRGFTPGPGRRGWWGA